MAADLAPALFTRDVAGDVDASWHAPAKTALNNLDSVLHGAGVYGFIFNTSSTPDDAYGTYNWCNMLHVRRTEYVKAGEEFELQYVEVVCPYTLLSSVFAARNIPPTLTTHVFRHDVDPETPQENALFIKRIPCGILHLELRCCSLIPIWTAAARPKSRTSLSSGVHIFAESVCAIWLDRQLYLPSNHGWRFSRLVAAWRRFVRRVS